MSKNLENIFTFPLIPPRDYQLGAWQAYNNGCKNILISLPRRGGKDLTSLSILVDYALKNPGANCVLLAPLLTQAVKIWWQKGQSVDVTDMVTGFKRTLKGSMLDIVIPRAIVSKINGSTHSITLKNGSVISLQGSRDLKSSAGQKISAVIISEAAQHDTALYPVISPILEESGGLTIINSTVTEPGGFFFKMVCNSYNLDSWHCTYLTAMETKSVYWISPLKSDGTRNYCVNPELEGKINLWTGNKYTNLQDKLELGENESLLIREYLNIPTNIEEGSYYASILNDLKTSGRLSDQVTVNKVLPVYAAMDLGISDKTAVVFFQVIRNIDEDVLDEIHFVDAYQNDGEDIGHYIDYIKSRPYKVNAVFVPHDSSNRSLQTGINLIELARTKYNFILTPISRSSSVARDVQLVKGYLKASKINEGLTELVAALNGYRENPRTRKPIHDDSSHYSDSVRYAIIVVDRKMTTGAMLDCWAGNEGISKPSLWVDNNTRGSVLDVSGQYPVDVYGVGVLDGRSYYMPDSIE